MDPMGSDPKAGRLLVATPLLEDPNFRRAVVLIVEHEDVQGTLGVVLNRPTAVGVGQVLEQWTELATEPSVVFRGGPVAPNSALALAMVPGKDEPIGWRPLDGAPALARLGLLDLDTPPRLLAPAITSLRVYVGYAGWSPASSRRRSTRAPGTCSAPSRATSSRATLTASGGRCCAARRATWRSSPPTRTTRRRTYRPRPAARGVVPQQARRVGKLEP